MKPVILTSLATAMLMAVSMSAQAQMGSSSNAMSNGAMSNSSMSSDASMTCQAMMDKANGMSQPTDANKKAMAMKQMDMAKAAMAKGDEASCKSHMKMAMHNMM